MITLLLPYPPTINHYYGVRGKSRYIKPEGINFRSEVKSIFKSKNKPMILGDVEIVINLMMPDKRKRDIDNVLKSLLDALTKAGAWKDDSQIVDLRIIKNGVLNGGGVLVQIRDVNEPIF